MRAFVALTVMSASVISIPTIALAAPAAPATGGTCASLAGDYEQIDKSLAMTYARGVGDDSAPRETNRQIEDSNDLARASMILTLMQAHHCAMPDHAPSEVRYIGSALSCATDRLKGTSEPDSCKMESWKPIK